MNVAVVVGNPKPNSRTRQVAEAVADRLVRGAIVIDLAAWDAGSRESTAQLLDIVQRADLLVVASPTYKATYTGLLKRFLDLVPTGGLSRAVAVPLMTGSERTHSLSVRSQLVPLLLELGAVVPGDGAFVVVRSDDSVDPDPAEVADAIRSRLKTVAAVSTGLLAT